jgi:hypothetical protein
MIANDHAALIGRLPPSKRRVFEALREAGHSLTDLEIHAALGGNGDPGASRTRRAELGKMGLVRQAKPGRRGGKKLWEVTPASEVEAVAEAAAEKGPRLRPVTEHPLETRVEAFVKLAADPEVQEAIENPDGSATRRERAKARAAIAQAKRERRRELKEKEAAKHPATEAIRLRNAVDDSGDYIRSLVELNDEEAERERLFGEGAVVPGEWERVLRHIAELERQTGRAYESIARRIGAPSRLEADVEYGEDEVEDAEFTDAAAALIGDLGGNGARLALPPGKE